MMAGLQDSYALLEAALHGRAALWLILLALVLTTFLLEDVAIAAGAALATQGALSWAWAFAAVAGGIALGDLGLYALGLGARRVPWLHRRYIAGRPLALKDRLESRLMSAVLLARVIPGMRLVTYTLCGFMRVSIPAFTACVLLAVTLWTIGLFWLSSTLGQAIASALRIPAPWAVALTIVAIAFAIPLTRHIRAQFKSRSA